MVIEYTHNPSWSAILALHAVVNPENDDAIAWSASLYANRVAQNLSKRIPRLQTLIQQWKNERGNASTLTSELQKNEDLKTLLLQETPWVIDANVETEQRNKLTELFDDNLLNQRISKAEDKLKALRKGDGSWSWFDGMEGNHYVTLAVCEHLAMLQHYLSKHGSVDTTVSQFLKDGLNYLDAKEVEDYNERKKWEKEPAPTEISYHWLYTRMLAQQAEAKLKEMASNAAEIRSRYLDYSVEHLSDFSMYGRANIACILLDDGRSQGNDFVRSLNEYLVQKAGMGKYFDTRKAAYSWMDHRIPTHLAAMRAIAMAKPGVVNDAQKTLQEMQLWLIRQKQVQMWDNVINTIGVCDMMLTIHPETTFALESQPTITLDGKAQKLPKASAGEGRLQIEVGDAQLDARTLVVQKLSPYTGWGAVYAQSLERTEKLSHAGEGLTITRQLLVPATGDALDSWRPLADGEPIKVGQRVRIRHTIAADRDYDFVQIRSQRAAALEPVQQLSGYRFIANHGAYVSNHDASTDVFFDALRKGTYTFDLEMFVSHAGHYQQGIATIQCAYSPAFSGRSSSAEIQVVP
jgi:hypothetical protein